MFEDYPISTLTLESSPEFHEVPQSTCEDCLYEIREGKKQPEILRKTNSLYERELKTASERPSSHDSEETEPLNQESNKDDELCESSVRGQEDHDESLSQKNDKKNSYPSKSYTTILPHIVLSGTWLNVSEI